MACYSPWEDGSMNLSKKSISMGMAKLDLYVQMMHILGDVLELFGKMGASFEINKGSANITEEMYNKISDDILPQIADIFEQEEVLARRMDQELMGNLYAVKNETLH